MAQYRSGRYSSGSVLNLPSVAAPKAIECSFMRARRGLNRPRVIIADDHRAVLEAEIALLSPHFDVVAAVANGVALVSEARRLNPDLVVTDITMPILDGIDALHELRASGSTAVFVFLTVHSEKEFVEACIEAGALGYVKKSEMKDHLVPAIQTAFAGRPYIA